MIDWVTARVSLDLFTDEDRETLRLTSDRIRRFCPLTGETRYETSAWDSIRSDSHSIVCRVTGSDLWVQGSPARVTGDGDNVFGSGASAAQDLEGCLDRMVAFLWGQLPALTDRPGLRAWKVTRVDVTHNLALDALSEVRQFLNYLTRAQAGRLRVDAKKGDSVYWNANSRYKKAKAYGKGPHLAYLMKRKDFAGRHYTPDEIALCGLILRLELTLFYRYWEKVLEIPRWWDLTSELLNKEWEAYFKQFIGTEVRNDEELRKQIDAVAPTAGQAKAAFNMWYMLKSAGYELTRENHTKTTWYRNLRVLKAAGLNVTDLGNGTIIPFPTKTLGGAISVSSWSELRQHVSRLAA